MRVPGESPAIPLVLSACLAAGVMIIYLTARPDRGPGLRQGLRPTRAQRRLLGLAPWRRLPVPLPRRRGTCVSLARYRLALCANFLPATGPDCVCRRQTRTSPKAVPGSSSPGHPGNAASASPSARRDHPPNSHDMKLWSESLDFHCNRRRLCRPPEKVGRHSMVREPRFELGTSRLSAVCSGQLSYPRMIRPLPDAEAARTWS